MRFIQNTTLTERNLNKSLRAMVKSLKELKRIMILRKQFLMWKIDLHRNFSSPKKQIHFS